MAIYVASVLPSSRCFIDASAKVYTVGPYKDPHSAKKLCRYYRGVLW